MGPSFCCAWGPGTWMRAPLQGLCHHVSLPNMSIHRQTCLTQQGRERSHSMVSGLVPLNISERSRSCL